MDKLTLYNLKEFNFLAKYYDSLIISWFFKRSYKKMKEYLDDIHGKKILSIGCGTGSLEIDLSQSYSDANIIGLDLSEEMLKRARKKINNLQNIHFLEGNVESLPFSSQSFDIIFCVHSFHHYSNQTKTLEEMRRVLVPNGKLIIYDQVKDNFFQKFLIFAIEKVIEPGVKFNSPEEWDRLFNKTNLKNFQIKNSGPICKFIIGTS